MKKKSLFECVECGYQGPKYYGKCPQCENWNSIIEVDYKEKESHKNGHLHTNIKAIKLIEIDDKEQDRVSTNITEFDRVLGGGLVPESIVLIGGEPGVGKSTLLLELAGLLSKNSNTLYYSGEESLSQIKMRADRLNIKSDNIHLLTMGSIEDVKDNIDVIKPEFLIIDSIQTIFSQKKGLISGSVSSLKYITGEIIELAKNKSITVFIIGHITKDGSIAGPKTLEHMVDVVLYFQGELKSDYRILRTEKNRFGPVDEIGVFQMTGKGLISVDDPSQLFIGQRDSTEPGLAVFPADRGTRAILLEIQALVTESPFAGNPRRISVGFDGYRMSMLLSVIEKKLKIPFYKSDVFINITGGMNIKETAGDLAVISALISSHKNIPLPTDTLIIGEVGLTGEIRPVGGIEKRIKEGIRQGYKNFILPEIQAEKLEKNNVKIKSIKNVLELYSVISGQ